MLKPLPLARLETPLYRLERASARLGAEVWIKRDDLTGFETSGNKVRKLRYLLAEALSQGADTVITCGGVQSNHCRATAAAARQLGLDPVLLLRREPPAPPPTPTSNLLLDTLLGAEIRWVDKDGWRDRDQRMAAIAEELRAAGRRPYVVPEGGSNAAGSLGYIRAAEELRAQAEAAGVRFDTVIHACGSGGTLAGLAMGGLDARVLGVCVCNDAAYFRGRVRAIAEELRGRPDLPQHALPPVGERWDALDGFVGRGYALSRPEELRGLARLARDEGVLLDPVYTGKAWHALERTLADAPRAFGDRILFWHTGGAFGLFGRGEEITSALSHAP